MVKEQTKNPRDYEEENREKKLKEKQLLRQRTRVYNDLVIKQKINLKKIKYPENNVFISLKNVNKIYDNKVQAVYDFNLNIQEKEFIVLVGPSGCGKSTTLRMIAGLEDITYGDLFIDGVFANDLHPKDRDIAMVFQSYALYPHLSVAGNMSFGLKIRKVPTLRIDDNGEKVLDINTKLIHKINRQAKDLQRVIHLAKDEEEKCELQRQIDGLKEQVQYLKKNKVEIYDNKHLPRLEIKQRVLQAARILQIEDYLFRKPKALSGGQKQRVALGRAIVRNAKVFLMDEPLSNLDAKLRVAMRSEIIKLHKSLDATTIYVTHDQTEAMTMASRIVVMNKGFIQQIGSPIEIYNKPANIFVATFIGSPAMNLIDVNYSNNQITFEKGLSLPLDASVDATIKNFYLNELKSCRDKLQKLDEGFVERNDYLEKIQSLNQVLSTHPNNEDKLKEILSTYLKELHYAEESNEERKQLISHIALIESLDLSKSIPVIFGLRPEDIYQSNRVLTDAQTSQPFDLVVSLAELLGHEYFVHTDFQGNEIVSKIHAKTMVQADDKIQLVFDLSKMHLFDPITQKIIL